MESKHPIESLMITSMTSIESMVDVNTIIGDSIVTADNTTIIPLSKVCFGFAAGGSEFNTNKLNKYTENVKLPFGGGAGAGVKISPVGFLVIKDGVPKILNVDGINIVDRAVDMIPDIINKIDGLINKKIDSSQSKKETKEKYKEPRKPVTKVDIDIDEDDVDDEFYEDDEDE